MKRPQKAGQCLKNESERLEVGPSDEEGPGNKCAGGEMEEKYEEGEARVEEEKEDNQGNVNKRWLEITGEVQMKPPWTLVQQGQAIAFTKDNSLHSKTLTCRFNKL